MSREVTPPQNQGGSVAIGDTPISKKQSGFASHSSAVLTRDGRFQHMASEISNRVVGPMPVSEFLDRYLRPKTSPNEQKGKVPNDFEALKAYTETPEDPYKALVDALQPICRNLKFKDTNKISICKFKGFDIKPDICVFEQGRDANVTEVEIMMELKSKTADDPFEDVRGDFFMKTTETGKKALGQTTLYAAVHQAAQFRTHSFSVLVFRKHARLLRWDRSGVIVTQAFLIISPEFIEFFQLYDQAKPQQRGIDTSVSIPSAEDASKARSRLGIDANIPLVQFSLDSSSKEAYIVSRDGYMNNALSPLGRSTRTFVAYSISDQLIVFLKDSWRINSQTPEHKIYAQLHANRVPHLPTVLAGSDISNQATLTQDVLEKNPTWLKVKPNSLRKHVHYRLILKEVAAPLSSFSSTQILAKAVCDAIEAHSAAFKAGILHRDISAGNIMIYNDQGLLIDWDLSKSTKDKGAREMERTGTWQFISCQLLKDPTATQSLTDDVESFIHVITWVSFQYAKHDMKDKALKYFLSLVYDQAYYDEDGIAKGGHAKMDYLLSRSWLRETEFENAILKTLLNKITKTISFRYQIEPSLEDNDGDKASLDHLLGVYNKKQEALKDSEWIIKEFNSALKLPGWPAGDRSKMYENTETAQSTTHAEGQSSLKRKTSEDAGGKGKKPRGL